MLKQKILFLFLLVLLVCLPTVHAQSDYQRIVVLGDPHLPFSTERTSDPDKQNRVVAAKIKVRDDINALQDQERYDDVIRSV